MPPLLTKPLTVVVLGSGGREHALAWKLSQSPHCREVIAVPGNGGMAAAGIRCEAAEAPGVEGVASLLRTLKADFVVIGPDDLLAAGYADELTAKGFTVFGPTRKASRIEWSKTFAKAIMEKAGVPTARSKQWASLDEARAGLAQAAADFGGYPLVLKYDGLALGKGVLVAKEEAEALEFLTEIFEGKKFQRGAKDAVVVLCEEFLPGHEVSVFALCDGKDAVVLDAACDHKRLRDGNEGPNTGGMGAYSPVPWLSRELLRSMRERVFLPVLQALAEEKAPFRGLLYAGLMMRGDGFHVLEFNARFGDPETQALLPRLESDLLPLLWTCAVGELERGLDLEQLHWRPLSCVAVVVASEGYPDAPKTGRPIRGLGQVKSQLFFAGVNAGEGKTLVTAGGRVLAVTALGDSLILARDAAYGDLDLVRFEGMQHRNDVGLLHE